MQVSNDPYYDDIRKGKSALSLKYLAEEWREGLPAPCPIPPVIVPSQCLRFDVIIHTCADYGPRHFTRDVQVAQTFIFKSRRSHLAGRLTTPPSKLPVETINPIYH